MQLIFGEIYNLNLKRLLTLDFWTRLWILLLKTLQEFSTKIHILKKKIIIKKQKLYNKRNALHLHILKKIQELEIFQRIALKRTITLVGCIKFPLLLLLSKWPSEMFEL